jgi:hypothetical protein
MTTRICSTVVLLILFGFGLEFKAGGDDGADGQLARFQFTTAAYRKEALRMVLEEANRVAVELALRDTLPITETNVIEQFILPYGAAQRLNSIGNVATSNYAYCVSIGCKLSYVLSVHQQQDHERWAAEYLWPVIREDTNAAYQLATQWLTAASMDVAGLNRDCDLQIHPLMLYGSGTNASFVPIYSVAWKSWTDRIRSVASVELFLPTKTLVGLTVDDSRYILRKPLEFTNLDYLLSQTNGEAPVPAFIRRTP